MKKLFALLAVMAVLIVPFAALAQDEGTVTVVHGVPDLEVDVYVNGELTLPAFTFRHRDRSAHAARRRLRHRGLRRRRRSCE